MKIAILASGSKGNSLVVSGKKTTIMIDAGISGKQISERLAKLNIAENTIQALFITHEHFDHIRSAGIVVRKYGIPLFINELTFNVGNRNGRLGKIAEKVFFKNGYPFVFNDLFIEPFSVPHDCVDNSCFRITEKDSDKDLVILTDLGFPTKLVMEKVKNPSTIVLESNHDLNKLINGPYEWWLKQRIKSRNGHLSNDQAGKLMKEILHNRLKNIILAHLSEENNEPDIAYSAMKKILEEVKINCNLVLAEQNNPIGWIEV